MILAGDIGGTNSRLGLFELRQGRWFEILDERIPTQGQPSLEHIAVQFLERHKARPQGACFGLPGPVKQGSVVTTNIPWVVEVAKLRAALQLDSVFLLNDLEAYAWGVAALQPEDFATLHAGAPDAEGNQAVISAGTGLGEAGLYWDGERHLPFPTEGGHTDFAPRDELEYGLMNFVRERFGRASWERVLSGPGLVNVYEYLRDVARVAVPAEVPSELRSSDPAATIARAALAHACPVAMRALDLFAVLYGVEAGNLALKMLSRGGLFLGGGIAPKILPKLQEASFLQSFFAKGRMRPVLEAMPVRVIMNDDCGLLGSARHAGVRLGLETRPEVGTQT